MLERDEQRHSCGYLADCCTSDNVLPPHDKCRKGPRIENTSVNLTGSAKSFLIASTVHCSQIEQILDLFHFASGIFIATLPLDKLE